MTGGMHRYGFQVNDKFGNLITEVSFFAWDPYEAQAHCEAWIWDNWPHDAHLKCKIIDIKGGHHEEPPQ